MKLPIIAFGDPVLRQISGEITRTFPNLSQLIDNMWETMYAANGVGLAAPQIGISGKLFVVDSNPLYENDEKGEPGFKGVFINPIIKSENGHGWEFEEGCLSIPGIRENVIRKPEIDISYYDIDFNKKQEKFVGYTARVIQHEYDHVIGKLFIDYCSPLKKQLLRSKLNDIQRGIVKTDYKMKFYRR